MKRIFILLSIAILSVTGLYAQEKGDMQAKQLQEQDMRAYMQKKDQELQAAIRTQTQYNVSEAVKRMDAQKREVQSDLESRRSRLMHRPEGMADLRLK